MARPALKTSPAWEYGPESRGLCSFSRRMTLRAQGSAPSPGKLSQTHLPWQLEAGLGGGMGTGTLAPTREQTPWAFLVGTV